MRWTWRGNTRTLIKYLALQTPGLFEVVLVLAALVRWRDLSLGAAAALLALWVVKDLALYPILRVAYEDTSSDATSALIGATATAVEALDPGGYVRVGAELWRAELAEGAEPISVGARVRVRAVRNLTLEVEPD